MTEHAGDATCTTMPRSTAKTDLALAGLVACAASLSGSTALAPHVVVVGGGWGGMGAAKAACEAGCKVTLLDALPDPTGRTPFLSASGKPVEAGTRGFWKDYPNIEAMMGELGLSEDEVFTPFLNSSFYSPFGLEATAPVFSEGVQLAADGRAVRARPRQLQRRQSGRQGRTERGGRLDEAAPREQDDRQQAQARSLRPQRDARRAGARGHVYAGGRCFGKRC